MSACLAAERDEHTCHSEILVGAEVGDGVNAERRSELLVVLRGQTSER